MNVEQKLTQLLLNLKQGATSWDPQNQNLQYDRNDETNLNTMLRKGCTEPLLKNGSGDTNTIKPSNALADIYIISGNLNNTQQYVEINYNLGNSSDPSALVRFYPVEIQNESVVFQCKTVQLITTVQEANQKKDKQLKELEIAIQNNKTALARAESQGEVSEVGALFLESKQLDKRLVELRSSNNLNQYIDLFTWDLKLSLKLGWNILRHQAVLVIKASAVHNPSFYCNFAQQPIDSDQVCTTCKKSIIFHPNIVKTQVSTCQCKSPSIQVKQKQVEIKPTGFNFSGFSSSVNQESKVNVDFDSTLKQAEFHSGIATSTKIKNRVILTPPKKKDISGTNTTSTNQRINVEDQSA